jgi:hypothetical protein
MTCSRSLGENAITSPEPHNDCCQGASAISTRVTPIAHSNHRANRRAYCEDRANRNDGMVDSP